MKIGPILRALGINVTEEHIKAIEEIIPQVPTKINLVISTINQAIQHFDGRLRAIETKQDQILEKLDAGRTDTGNTPS